MCNCSGKNTRGNSYFMSRYPTRYMGQDMMANDYFGQNLDQRSIGNKTVKCNCPDNDFAQNLTVVSAADFVSEIYSIVESAQRVAYNNPLVRIATASSNISNSLNDLGIESGPKASSVICYSGRDGRTFVLDFATNVGDNHVIVLIQDGLPIYWAKAETSYVAGKPILKAFLTNMDGSDKVEIVIGNSFNAFKAFDPHNPPPPVAPNTCRDSGSVADCIRCSQLWLENNYFWIYILHQVWGLGNASTLGACLAFCAQLPPPSPKPAITR